MPEFTEAKLQTDSPRKQHKTTYHIQQDSKKRYKKGSQERKHKKMANPLGGNNERRENQNIFSKCRK
jgi:hypothetical protein